jgi:hypothetical protein
MTEIRNFLSAPFLNAENAISFLKDNDFLPTFARCSKCTSRMKILKCSRKIDGYAYICTNQECKKVISLLNCFTTNLKTPIHKFLHAIYSFVSDFDISQSVSICEISAPNYIKIKNELIEIIKSINNDNMKIGGLNIEVQFDETAIYNGRIISDPLNTMDDVEGIQWILGGIEKNNISELFLKLVQNRRKETLLTVFNNKVNPVTIFVTDGYPFYVPTARNFGAIHKVVNYTT